MKKYGFVYATIFVALFTLLFAGCDLLDGLVGGSGTVKLNLSDAPIDDSNVNGVWITVNEIQYNLNEEWVTMSGFEGPETYNLLELTGENVALLGDLDLPAGQYSQIRFMLDIPEEAGQTQSNPGCYISYEDGSTDALFVPSGGQSGFKATGAFDVPRNGTVEVTADFDVRKAVVATGSGRFILKPTIRLIVNAQAGKITGTITNRDPSTYPDIVVYAYEDGGYDESTEAAEPGTESARFPNAVSSASPDETGTYVIPLLAAQTYDLVVTGANGAAFGAVLGYKANVVVEEKKAASVAIDTGDLATAP